jgi:hypothetical protein
MHFHAKSLLTALAAVGLAACGADPAATKTDGQQPAEVTTSQDDGQGALESAVTAEPSGPPSGAKIRGKGGLEELCQAKVAVEVGAPVIGTNRIEESEAAIEIYVNVDGAEAPWKCLGYKDGTIGEIMYTGSEGAA